jgi:hypothetical protein
MRALIDDAPVIDHREPIHPGNRRQAMGNRDHHASFHQCVQSRASISRL